MRHLFYKNEISITLHHYHFFTFFVCSLYFSQEKPIETKFNQDGFLYENIDDSSPYLAQFKEDDSCVVISYLGDYVYNIKYKGWEGLIKDKFLFINESMMDLFFDHEEKLRIKAIEQRDLRQKNTKEIVNKIQDSIAKIEEEEEEEEEERKQHEAIQKAIIKQEQLTQLRITDSIAKIKEQQRNQNEALEMAKIQEEIIKQREKANSINKVKEQQKQKNEALEKERFRQEQINRSKKEDSIDKIKEKHEEKLNSIERNEFRNTCHYLINKYDDYYKQQIIITDKYPINEILNIELIREGNASKININLSEDLGCVSYVPATRSTVRVTLENNQVIVFYHSGSLDCTDFSLKALLSQSKINQLKISPIKSFTFRGTRRSKTITNIDYKDFFIDKLDCIE